MFAEYKKARKKHCGENRGTWLLSSFMLFKVQNSCFLHAGHLKRPLFCFKSLSGKMKMENEVSFHGTSSCYFELLPVLLWRCYLCGLKWLRKNSALISYHWGHAFQFYFKWFAKNSEMGKDAILYMIVEAALSKTFKVRRDPYTYVKDAF